MSTNSRGRPHSDRIEEIEELIFKGSTYDEIAKTLNIAIDTVKWHVKKLLKARGCQTRSHLMADEIERSRNRFTR